MSRIVFQVWMVVCSISILHNISIAKALSPTFLPMLEGEWRVDIEHDKDGRSSKQKCFTLSELVPIYSAQILLMQAKENKQKCRMTAENTRNSQVYVLKCDEHKLRTIESYSLIKKAYNKYILVRELSTEPYTRAINYVETTTFTRIGRCLSSN
ncbi:hypothetical protein [Wohlfahrtiimonas larvae]|uniref:DUF306 domain-containing protein n=1 Tax=Wohlfahrtiimonas larvae TaxID=1157986 RepID=A0ABP9MWI4_9GAMM|nr:hypothetical protein [Wohlfahrtiimonas larvae]